MNICICISSVLSFPIFALLRRYAYQEKYITYLCVNSDIGRKLILFFIMSENTERVYCYGNDNSAALMGALMAKQPHDNNGMLAAMMNGGMNNWMNNPFVYLVWMMFANRFWNNNGEGQGNAIQGQLDALRNQMADNQNSNLLMDAVKGNNVAIGQLAGNLNCDFNTLNAAICDVRAGIDKVAGAVGLSGERVVNAVTSGNAAVTSALQTCCCQTQQAILKMGYENQLANCQHTNTLQNGQQNIVNVLTQGFAATNYERQKQTCDILQAGEKNTQRIVDVLNQHWQADLQQRYNDARLELSQQRQNAELIAALKSTTATTA